MHSRCTHLKCTAHHSLTLLHRVRAAQVAEIGGFDASWALGAMVYEVAEGMGAPRYGPMGGVLAATAVGGALLVVLAWWCCARGHARGAMRAGDARRVPVRLH